MVMNAATSIITTKSPTMARTSVRRDAEPNVSGTWAATKGGVKKVFTMVSDYGPGHDAEGAFISRLQGSRRRDHRSVRFRSPTGLLGVRAARQDSNSRRIYIWIPGGAQPAAVAKALFRARHRSKKTKILWSGCRRRRLGAQGLGEQSAGIITVTNFDYNHDSALGKSFLAASARSPAGANPELFAIGGYDGMHLIYESLKKTGGKTDGDRLIEAPRA